MFLTALKSIVLELIPDIYFTLKPRGKNYPKPPLYPNSHTLKKYPFPGHLKTRVISFETPDDFESVYHFYKNHLTRNGWKLEDEYQDDSKMSFLYHHPKYHLFKYYRPRKFHRHLMYGLDFKFQNLEGILHVEIHYKILGPFFWRDDNF